MSRSNDDSSKLARQWFLVTLGVLTTTLITIFGIWGDDEISVHTFSPRDPSPLDNREEFGRSMITIIENDLNYELCENPDKFFSKLSIAQSPLIDVLKSNYWNSDLPNLEQEAYRRCESRKVPNTIQSCFSFYPESEENKGFLASDHVFVELYLNFRDPFQKKGISCKEALMSHKSQLSIYYSMYWQDNLNPKDFHRITGGKNMIIEGKLEASLN